MPGSQEKDINEFMDFWKAYMRIHDGQDLRMFAAAVLTRRIPTTLQLPPPKRSQTTGLSSTWSGKRLREEILDSVDEGSSTSADGPVSSKRQKTSDSHILPETSAHNSVGNSAVSGDLSFFHHPQVLQIFEYLVSVNPTLEKSTQVQSQFMNSLDSWWTGSFETVDFLREISEWLNLSEQFLEGLVRLLALKDGTAMQLFALSSSAKATVCAVTCTDDLRQAIVGDVDILINSPSVWAPGIIQLLQLELDNPASNLFYRKMCMKQLRRLSKKFQVLPPSLILEDIATMDSRATTGGGFADIWRGTFNGQMVCLKVLRIFLRSDGATRNKVINDFCREALIWRQLKHPNVLPFLGVNTELFSPSFCLVSPSMSNSDLIHYSKIHPDYDRINAIKQLADGMNYLHSFQPPIVHGDIKGANILISDNHQCCLADFGLAVATESQSLGGTTTNGVRGSTRWLAPELFDLDAAPNVQNLTPRDIYAFGCTAYEILAGHVPFVNLSPDAKIMMAVLRGVRPSRPDSPLCHDYIWNLVEKCWAQEASSRPRSEQICEALIRDGVN
ncbi:kinase-like protein [Dendrothele bispora CBS 962.96]|uniref:Kinase-like protein n=1 Tax=Dendrothele bispora (strain CBS 962.96) TaxID=1314807 RepID=A0A4S8KX41_DENBC|nr:kinase-like protein [Dendrothele bispora CBS 962.96]